MGGITLTETVLGQTLSLAANGSFTFASPVLSGAAYNVTVTTGDNKTFSIALPGINLFAGTQYRTRVLGTATGVKDANSLTMATDFTQATGFTTSGPARRYSFTASSLNHRSDPDNATGLFVLAGSSTTTTGHDGNNNGGRRFDGSTTTLDSGAGSATGLPEIARARCAAGGRLIRCRQFRIIMSVLIMAPIGWSDLLSLSL